MGSELSQETILCDFVAATDAEVVLSNWQCSGGLPDAAVCSGSQSAWSGITCEDGRVTSLYVYSYSLTGTLPSSLGALLSLQTLTIGYTLLQGTIPSSLGRLSNLYILSLSSPYLSGPIPSSLGLLANLRYLTIASNSLNGPIPASLCHLNLSSLVIYNVRSLTCSPRCWADKFSSELSAAGLESCVSEGTMELLAVM